MSGWDTSSESTRPSDSGVRLPHGDPGWHEGFSSNDQLTLQNGTVEPWCQVQQEQGQPASLPMGVKLQKEAPRMLSTVVLSTTSVPPSSPLQ